MRYKEILFENLNEIYKPLSINDIDFNKCNVALENYKKGIRIYRGMPSDIPILYGDYSNNIRRSTDTNNYYTEILDNSPDWRDYPKRSKSFICSMFAEKTEEMVSNKNMYVVLPIGNPVFGVCPKIDIWYSFNLTPFGFYTLFVFNASIKELMNILLGNDNDTYENILEMCSVLDKTTIKENDISSNSFKLYEYLKDGYNSLKSLQELLSPTRNNFSKYKFSSLSKINDKEVWFSGPAYFIRKNALEKLIKEINL